MTLHLWQLTAGINRMAEGYAVQARLMHLPRGVMPDMPPSAYLYALIDAARADLTVGGLITDKTSLPCQMELIAEAIQTALAVKLT